VWAEDTHKAGEDQEKNWGDGRPITHPRRRLRHAGIFSSSVH
jgi:hypothetical protein